MSCPKCNRKYSINDSICQNQSCKYEFQPAEEQILLQVPNHIAAQIRSQARKNKGVLDLKIANYNERQAVVKLNGQEMKAKLVDLPCIIECQKTFNNTTFLKSADISQMLIVPDKHSGGSIEDISEKRVNNPNNPNNPDSTDNPGSSLICLV